MFMKTYKRRTFLIVSHVRAKIIFFCKGSIYCNCTDHSDNNYMYIKKSLHIT